MHLHMRHATSCFTFFTLFTSFTCFSVCLHVFSQCSSLAQASLQPHLEHLCSKLPLKPKKQQISTKTDTSNTSSTRPCFQAAGLPCLTHCFWCDSGLGTSVPAQRIDDSNCQSCYEPRWTLAYLGTNWGTFLAFPEVFDHQGEQPLMPEFSHVCPSPQFTGCKQ